MTLDAQIVVAEGAVGNHFGSRTAVHAPALVAKEVPFWVDFFRQGGQLFKLMARGTLLELHDPWSFVVVGEHLKHFLQLFSPKATQMSHLLSLSKTQTAWH